MRYGIDNPISEIEHSVHIRQIASGDTQVPFGLRDYINVNMDVKEGTPGGPTFIVADEPRCFAYVSSHYNAVKALTNGKSTDYQAIKRRVVLDLAERGIIQIDQTDCIPDYGFMGCKVWDVEGVYLGAVGDRCQNPAGHATSHVGTGRCKFHNGNLLDSPRSSTLLVKGTDARMLQKMVKSRVAEYLATDDRTDLSWALATERALLDVMIECGLQENGIPLEGRALVSTTRSIQQAIDLYGVMVKRISDIERSHALTASQVLYLQVTVVDILNKYVTDPLAKERAAIELAERLGTSGLMSSHLLTDGIP